MSKERKDGSFVKKPVYPGGTAAFKKFITENIKYPQEALDNKIEGTVFLTYTIDYKGNVTETKVLKGIGHGCNEEAERIIKLLIFDIPKGPRKLRVTFNQKTQINFKLPTQKPVTPVPPSYTNPVRQKQTMNANATLQLKSHIRYTIVPSKAKRLATAQKKKKKGSYTYTFG